MKNVYENFYQIFKSIELCMENQLITPSLILLYSGMDIASSLATSGCKDVQKSDFVAWTEKYLVPKLEAQCNGSDLYAARCAVVHSLSAESSMSKKGLANQIVYSWGGSDHELFKESTKLLDNFICIKIEDLIQAFRFGVADFIGETKQESKTNVSSRSKKMLTIIDSNDQLVE